MQISWKKQMGSFLQEVKMCFIMLKDYGYNALYSVILHRFYM